MKTTLHLICSILILSATPPAWALDVLQPSDVEKPTTVQFEGRVVPAATFQLRLRGGEEVRELLVEDGQQVMTSSPLAHLADQQIISGYGVAVERQVQFTRLQYTLEKLQIVQQSLITRKKDMDGRMTRLRRLAGEQRDTQLNEQLYSLEQAYMDLRVKILSNDQEIEFTRASLALYEPLMAENRRILELLQRKIAALTIVSPIDGVVKKRHPHPGRANPGDLLLEIWNTSRVEILAEVSQNHIEYLQLHDEVRLNLDYYSDDAVTGTIVAIGDADTNSTASGPMKTIFPVTIAPEPDDRLRIGNSVIVRLSVKTPSGPSPQ